MPLCSSCRLRYQKEKALERAGHLDFLFSGSSRGRRLQRDEIPNHLDVCLTGNPFPLVSVADEFKGFLKGLPTDQFLNVSTIAKYWSADFPLQRRYAHLESGTALVLAKAQKIVRKLFTLSKRCPKQPRISLPRERYAL